MARLKTLSGEEVLRIMRRHGFLEVRRRGSHAVMQFQEGERTITVPVPMHSELRIGTLRSIIRQSGIPRTEFESG
ncbi:MAG: type II toxin-antitoxin system HicA family toxin [SAR324 cluster bacterium]|nr:type II toxin-antitoxin system HicA family toxin [SAR324 cluster bacterium]MCH8886264.1 type II toxin-antitoxin system HicA family toxin [SAR324 cluster bacterium]